MHREIVHFEQMDESKIFTTDFFLLQEKSGEEIKTIGYSKVKFIKGKDSLKIMSPENFYCHIINFDNKEASTLFEQNREEFFLKYLQTKDEQKIQERLGVFNKRKQYFLNYWIDKPSIEIIRVQDENTTDMPYIINNELVFKKIEDDKKRSYQGQKLSYMLYNHLYEHYAEKNLKLWKSNKTNEITNKIWERHEFEEVDDRKYMKTLILPSKITTLQKFT